MLIWQSNFSYKILEILIRFLFVDVELKKVAKPLSFITIWSFEIYFIDFLNHY